MFRQPVTPPSRADGTFTDSLYALNIGGQIDEDQGKKEDTHGQTGSC